MDLQEAAAALGMYWPKASPRRLRAASVAYRRLASDMSAIACGCASPARLVLAHNQGPPIDAFAGHWERWHRGADSLAAAVAACDQLADALDAFAQAVDKTRHRVGKLVGAAAGLLGCAHRQSHARHPGHRAAAVLAGLVAASWAEREALLAAAERAGALAGLRASGGRHCGGPGPMPGSGRTAGASASFRRQPRITSARSTTPVAVGPGAPSLPLAAALPGLPVRPPIHFLPTRLGVPPIPSHAAVPRSPASGLGLAVHRAAGLLGSTELLAGVIAAGAAAAGWSAAAALRASRHPRGEESLTDWVGKVLPPGRRHHVAGVGDDTLRSETTGVVAPWVDVTADVEAIRGGLAVHHQSQLLDDQFTLPSGRVYGVERLPNGHRMLYPVSGPGVEALSRMQMKALAVYNQLGDTPRAAATLERTLSAAPADSELALRLSRATHPPST